MNSNVIEFMDEMLATDFFSISCNFSKAEYKAYDDKRCLIQSMMLLDINDIPKYEIKGFSDRAVLAYFKNIREDYGNRQRNTVRSALQYLENAFPEKNQYIRKISIPMLIYLADIAEYKEIAPRFFRDWWIYFTEEEALFEKYKLFCSSGSMKQEKIQGRLSIMVQSFCKYFEVEYPEALEDMIEEVE